MTLDTLPLTAVSSSSVFTRWQEDGTLTSEWLHLQCRITFYKILKAICVLFVSFFFAIVIHQHSPRELTHSSSQTLASYIKNKVINTLIHVIHHQSIHRWPHSAGLPGCRLCLPQRRKNSQRPVKPHSPHNWSRSRGKTHLDYVSRRESRRRGGWVTLRSNNSSVTTLSASKYASKVLYIHVQTCTKIYNLTNHTFNPYNMLLTFLW